MSASSERRGSGLFPCYCCPWENTEVTGWMLDGICRGMLGISGTSFLSAALLYRASKAAGCPMDDDVDCDNKIYGLKPTSLLFLLGSVVGVMAAFLSPICGAVIDHTSRRWEIGAATGYALVFINALQLLIVVQDAWGFVVFLQLLYILVLYLHGTVLLAYLPETTSDPKFLDVITFASAAWQFGAMSFLLLLSVAISLGAGLDTIGTCVASQVLAVAITTPLMLIAWGQLFGQRPASHQLPKGSSVLTHGFKQLSVTFHDCRQRFTQIPKWLLGYIFAEAAAESYASVSVTYLVEEIDMEGGELGAFFFCAVLLAVPGAFVGKIVTKRVGKFYGQMLGFAFFSLITLILPFVAYRPAHSHRTFVFGAFIGIALGWIFASNRTVWSAMIPGGEEAAYMGLYLFAGQVLAWLPPTVFLALNESGLPLRWGIWSVGIMMMGGTLLMLRTDFKKAVKDVESTLCHRFTANEEAGPTSQKGDYAFDPVAPGAGAGLHPAIVGSGSNISHRSSGLSTASKETELRDTSVAASAASY